MFIVLDNVYSSFKQNIKSCNAKRRRQRWRTAKNNNRSNQQKRNFAHAVHFFCTFLYRCFARLQRETSRNFLVTRFFRSLFFHCRSFSPCIGGRQHFSFCYRRYKIFMLFFQPKHVSFVFYLSLQISVTLFLVELRWPAAYFLFFCVPLALYSKVVEMTLNLSLILQTTRIQRQFPLSVFVFIDSLVVSALQDGGG